MSRIHDALKRAEQERATSTGTHVEPTLDQSEVAHDSMPALQTTLQSSPSTTMSGSGAGLNYEALLARCPQSEWSPDPRTMLFFQEDDSRLGAEEFRTLRSRLYQIREKMPLKRLLVTSALPKEGKSFVAANLAQVMVRQHGRRALMIDADLRNPGMHRHFGVKQSPGLSEYLLGECDEFAAPATRGHGKPVLPARGPLRCERPRTARQRPSKAVPAAGRAFVRLDHSRLFARHPRIGCHFGRRCVRWHSHGRALCRDTCRFGSTCPGRIPRQTAARSCAERIRKIAAFQVLLWRGRDQPCLR